MSDDVRVCPACGRTNPEETTSCLDCGRDLSDEPLRPTKTPPGFARAPRFFHNEAGAPRQRPETAGGDPELQSNAMRGGVVGIAEGGGGGPRRLGRRRRGHAAIAIGLALLILGASVIGAIYAVNAAPHSLDLKANDTWTLSPTTLTGLTAAVSWEAMYNGTKVYLVYGHVDCIVPSGVVASGSGTNGSFRAALDPGTTYFLYACLAQASAEVNLTVSLLGGLTLAEVVAAFMIGIGLCLMAVGIRGRPIVVHPPAHR